MPVQSLIRIEGKRCGLYFRYSTLEVFSILYNILVKNVSKMKVYILESNNIPLNCFNWNAFFLFRYRPPNLDEGSIRVYPGKLK